MSRAEVEALLAAAGFSAVEAEGVEAAVRWPDAATAASSILGTPMGPLVEQLPDDHRIELMDGLVAAFGDGPVERRSVAIIARATA